MNQEEIAALVVRLTGDASGYQRMLDTVVRNTKSAMATVMQTVATVGEYIGIKGAVSAFTDLDDSITRIESALKANGQDVQAVISSYTEFNNELERTTRLGATVATRMEAVAAGMGLFGDQAKQAVKDAVAMSAIRGGSPEAYLQSVISAQKYGYWQRLMFQLGMGRSGAGMMGEGAHHGQVSPEVMKQIRERLNQGFEQAQALGGNFGGQLQRINNLLHDFTAELGGIVAKWSKPFVDMLTKAVKWVKALDPPLKELIVLTTGFVAVLTGAGPLMRFVTLLVRLVSSISPLTIALTAAAGATAIWVRSVGGLGEAWGIVRGKLQEFIRAGLDWLQHFIATHQRLTLGVSLAATALGALIVTWKTLRTTLAVVDGILTTLYVKQLAQNAILIAWSSAAFLVETALQAIATVLSGAAWIGGIAYTIAKLGVLTVAYYTYYAAIIAGQAATTAFTIVSAAFGSVIGGIAALASGGAVLWAAYSAAVWAVNVAMSVGAGIFAATSIAIAGVASWIGTVAALFGAGFVAAWVTGKQAVQGFLDTLLTIPGHSGPLAHVGSLFQEWFGILKDVYHAVTLLPGAINKAGAAALGLKKDMSGMDLAWELLVAGFDLAKAQIQAAWPPLWKFIQTTANSAWKVIQAGWDAFVAAITPPFKEAFYKLALYMQATLGQAMSQFFSNLVQPAEGLFAPLQRQMNHWASRYYSSFVTQQQLAEKALKQGGYKGMADDMKRAQDAIAALNEELKRQQAIIAAAAKDFNVADTDEVKQARQRVQQLQKLIGAATDEQKKMTGGVDLAAPFKAAEKEMKKWEATLFGSAESYSRVTEYMDKLDEMYKDKGAFTGGERGPAGEGPRAPEVATPPNGNDRLFSDRAIAVLERIDTHLNNVGIKGTVTVIPAKLKK